MKLFNSFDRIRVINMKSRKDRYKLALAEAEKWGYIHHPDFSIVEAQTPTFEGPFAKVGSHGAFSSTILEMTNAYNENKSILILQDDCKFVDRFAEGLKKIVGADIFIGGWVSIDTKEMVGAHCMGFSHLALYHLLFGPYALSKCTKKPFPPIDGLVYDFIRDPRARGNLTAEFRYVATQYHTKSDITPSWVDRVPVLQNVASLYREIFHR